MRTLHRANAFLPGLLLLLSLTPVALLYAGEETKAPAPAAAFSLAAATEEPGEILAYLDLPRLAAMESAFAQTALGTALRHPDIAAYLDAVWQDRNPVLAALLHVDPAVEPGAHDEEAVKRKSAYEYLRRILDLLGGRCELLLLADPGGERFSPALLGGINLPEPPQAEALAVLMAKAANDRIVKVVDLDRGFFRFEGDRPLLLALSKTTLLFFTRDDPERFAALRARFETATADPLASARAAVGAAPAAPFAWLSLAPLHGLLDETEDVEDEDAAALRALLRLFAFDRAAYLAFGGSPETEAIRHTLYLRAPAWKEGLLGGLRFAPPAAEAGGKVPGESDCLLAFDLDLERPWAEWTARWPAETAAKAGAFLDAFAAQAHLDLRADLGRLLTGRIELLPARGDALPRLFPPDFLLRVGVKDPALLEQALAGLRRSALLPLWRKIDIGGTTIHYINRWAIGFGPGEPLPLAPAYAVSGDALLVAPYPHLIERFLARTDRSTLAERPAWRNALRPLAAEPAGALFYMASHDEMPAAYGLLAAALHATTAIPGLTADPALLPPPSDLSLSWGDATVALLASPEGLRLDCRGPLGALTPLAWAAGGLDRTIATGPRGLANAALGTLIAVPALFESREASRRAESRARLERLGKAYALFREKEGRRPGQLDELAAKGYAAPGDLLSPLREGTEPYILLPVGAQPGPRAPLLREPYFQGAWGIHALFEDGTVDWVPRPRMEEIFGGVAPVEAPPLPADETIGVF